MAHIKWSSLGRDVEFDRFRTIKTDSAHVGYLALAAGTASAESQLECFINPCQEVGMTQPVSIS